jgi:hypothetical protein
MVWNLDNNTLYQITHIMQQTQMSSLSSVLEKLRIKKMDNEFRWENGTFSGNNGNVYKAEDLAIIKVYRFEGESDPGDSSVLYIFKASNGMIGYSIDAYGIYSNQDDEEGYNNFLRQVPMEDREEQVLFDI